LIGRGISAGNALTELSIVPAGLAANEIGLRYAMKWMLERDALIAQTLAFVQSVTGKRDLAGAPVAEPIQADVGPTTDMAPSETTVPDELPSPAPAVIAEPAQGPSSEPRPVVPGDVKTEITARIASFRAHQERFNRERDEYFSTTLQKLRAAIKDGAPIHPDK
jgi:hypothetical protein